METAVAIHGGQLWGLGGTTDHMAHDDALILNELRNTQTLFSSTTSLATPCLTIVPESAATADASTQAHISQFKSMIKTHYYY